MKKFMVIEQFKPGAKAAIYDRFQAKGRMLPTGFAYVDSWLECDGDRCFQLMEARERSLFDAWTQHWEDLIQFEIVELGDKPKPKA